MNYKKKREILLQPEKAKGKRVRVSSDWPLNGHLTRPDVSS